MRLRLYVSLFAAGLMTFGYLAKPATADDFNKAITFQFKYPVEVPGQILVPGTYVFQLAEPAPPVYSLAAIQIFSKDQKGTEYLVCTAMAIPAYYADSETQPAKVPDKPIIIFEERPGNKPEAVGKWFYPGENRGWEFVYPKGQRFEAAANAIPEPAAPVPMAAAPAARPALPAPALVVQPEPMPIAQNLPVAPLSVLDLKTESSATREVLNELPTTASDFPLAAALGLLLMGSGGAVLGFGLIRSKA